MSTSMKAMTMIGLTALAIGAGVSGADAKNSVVRPVTCEPDDQARSTGSPLSRQP